MSYAWTAPYIPYLIRNDSHISTTIEVAQWLEPTLMYGSLCGLPLTMYLVNKIGRKKSLLLAALGNLVGWITIALANRIEYLFAVRFLSGMCGNMAFVAVPMYIAEIAEQNIRGLLSSIITLMSHIGCLTVYCVGPFLPFYVSPIIAGSILTLELLIFPFVPESPHFLLYKNRLEEAKKSLKYFRPGVDTEKELKDISESIESQKRERGKIQDLLLVKSNRKALLIMTVLNSGQHLCAYTVILMNMHLILEAAGAKYMEPSTAAILYASVMLLASTITSFQVDKYGRKVLLIISTIMTGVCLFTLAIYFNLKSLNFDVLPVSWIPIVSVMVYAAVFKCGLGVVPIIITSEIFPLNLKAIGMTIADGIKEFEKEDDIVVRDRSIWQPAKIVQKMENIPRSYIVEKDNGSVEELIETTSGSEKAGQETQQQYNEYNGHDSYRRSNRDIRLPKRFTDYKLT
ncbi:hypothetical protein NQ314_011570 [Rhamnusium bicolor]|uniref:Major facilitator superfamily (MFS) profile domain-containing protein n=1 Tax=Rhamnusium bicolor TaxID=1586634 RepID=A0AAV8XI79_9CUCU|nr:hypothetical protein NQ314_011570 [Rhamnusium bicolor]